MAGMEIRLGRLQSPISSRSVIVTLDATLFSGPRGALATPSVFANAIAAEEPDAILAFPGLLASISPGRQMGRIVNGTASTTFNDPAEKVSTATPASVVRQGGDAVALHINLGHRRSPQMLSQVAHAIADFERAGIPALVASYVPDADPSREWRKIVHAARIASDLGAAVVKTAYTGDPETYVHVVDAAAPASVVAAGGSPNSTLEGLEAAKGAVMAGAWGVAYGRTIFESSDPMGTLRALKGVVHELAEPALCLEHQRGGSRDDQISSLQSTKEYRA